MARPSKYNATILEKAEHYIINYIKYGDQIPMIDGLALELGIHRDTVNDWEKKYPEFSDIVRTLMTHQGRKLMNGSLSGEFRERTATLALSSNHGLVAKTQTDITSSDETMKPPTIIQLVAKVNE
tara:strand:- start:10030 stop:10404 length:375 start_codon:yes stop_codon:yes gene_type:complete